MNKKNNNHGFSLLELIISNFIFAVAVAVIATMFYYFYNSYSFSFEQVRTLSEVKVVGQDIFSELREIRISEDGAYPLFVANDNEIGFYTDLNKNGRVERVRYYLDGNAFYKGVVTPNDTQNPYEGEPETITLISDVVVNGSNPVFTYYNQLYTGGSSQIPLAPGDRLLHTRLVEVTLLLNTSNNTQEPVEISTRVMLRNLKTNY